MEILNKLQCLVIFAYLFDLFSPKIINLSCILSKFTWNAKILLKKGHFDHIYGELLKIIFKIFQKFEKNKKNIEYIKIGYKY